MGCLPEIAMYRRISRFGAPGAIALPVTQDGLVPETQVPILEYIKRTWTVLTRSHQNLAVAAADPKQRPLVSRRWPLYISRTENMGQVTQTLRGVMKPGDFDSIEIRTLPPAGAPIKEHGLLYLPRPYVVPGGRFNEMYGWDSFFISMGLLRDGEIELARDMAENFLYELREYGMVLNANRTYYLTRSQPPFLTEMLLGVYARTHDRKWLENTIPVIEQYYRYWTSAPHLTPETGLSRYFDLGEGPAPEVVAAEGDQHGRNEYDLIEQYFRTHRTTDYDVSQYYDSDAGRLTPLFYKSDRAMRESGFDPSTRFGPFSADIIHYNPVCLNSLLYIMEIQSAEILEIAGRKRGAETWRGRARERAARINRLMWDPSRGMYFDYDFARAQVRPYPFLTTFYPLWAGVATQEQADQVAGNLSLFDKPGGLQTSTTNSGDQWDAPFGWAPLQWIAVEGLRRYGYEHEANRISSQFLSLVLAIYRKHGTLLEKYDVVRSGSNVARKLRYGYRSNEAGFGWTNAVFTNLVDALPEADRSALSADLLFPKGVSSDRRAPGI
jgi:alpha,alpha-trehalase